MMDSPDRVLVLDDDTATLVLTKRRLERSGFLVISARSIAEAAPLVTDGPTRFDVIVLDYALEAQESGLDFLRALNARGLTIPSILITGHVSEERILEALRAGVADVLRKTEGYLEFLPVAVRRVLDVSRTQIQLAVAREGQRYYRSLANAIPHLICMTSTEGALTYVNTPWAEYTGVDDALIRGLDWVGKCVHREDRAQIEAAFRTSASGVAFTLSARLAAASGQYRWFSVRGVLLDTEINDASRVLLTFSDIDQQYHAELEMESSLERERAARATAESATRAKDEFVASLSHELRSPLNAIVGWTEVLLRDASDPAKRRIGLEIILRNAKAQAKMIDDLLDISSILAGRLRLEIQPVDLAMVLDATLLSVQPAIEAKGIRLNRITASVAPIQGDPARLQQVFWNLIMNAIKFTEKGGSITVMLAKIESEIAVVISDNGRGISKDFMPFVFDRFRQEANGPARPRGGLGLGLAIVRQFVELHGGHVAVESEGEGTGSAFTVRFPVPSLSVKDHGGSIAALSAHATPLASVRVLVVEDEPDARAFLEDILRGFGATVDSAADAVEARAAFEHQTPTVILSDVGLPGEDGYQFIASVRRFEEANGRKATPAIALTALSRPEDRQKSLISGFNAHLPKPVDSTELVLVLASFAGVLNAKPRPELAPTEPRA